MSRIEKAQTFAALHVKGTPLVLYNAWDAGSAKAIVAAGAKAVATGSWSLAAAQGYRDGEDIPFAFACEIAGRIAATIDVPVTIDFEGGYAEDDGALAANARRLLEHGIAGINFEDRVVKGAGLYEIDRQARRIAAIRRAAEAAGLPLFINARTDVFFVGGAEEDGLVEAALERAKAFAAAGASGLFVPGVAKEASIAKICEAVSLPVNVMVMDGVPPKARLAQLGVSRISYGPIPYVQAMRALQQGAEAAFA